MSDTDSETEPSLSQELSHQKGLAAESLWAGNAVQANRCLTAVLTVEQPLVVNVTDGLLSSLQDLVEGEELATAESELVNNLGGEGSIVYTEIKVMDRTLHYLIISSSPLQDIKWHDFSLQNGQERVLLQAEEEADNSSE